MTSTDTLNELRAGLERALRENQRLAGENQRLAAENGRLLERIGALEQHVEAAQRAGKRQAAPFSKGTPKEDPQTPGRKRGAAHGHHARRDVPDHVDEIVDVALPAACGRCGGTVEQRETADQFQIELPVVTPQITRFTVALGRCADCGHAAHGRHPLQTSDALGAAGVQLGPRLLAHAAMLHYEYGLSFCKVTRVLEGMTGIHVSAGGLTRALRRLGNGAIPTYDQLCEQMAKESVVTADETGWRVGGWNAWLWDFVAPRSTVYAIENSRAADVARSVLGAEFSGILVRDGWSPYRQFTKAVHQTCLAHLLRRAHEMLDVADAERWFPTAVKQLLQDALTVRDQRDGGLIDAASVAMKVTDLELRADGLLVPDQVSTPANKRFRKHLATERDALFTFLKHPGAPATNWRGEQGIRPAVVNRKVWGGNREWTGARTQEMLMSLLRTARQRMLDPLPSLIELMRSPVPICLPLLT